MRRKQYGIFNKFFILTSSYNLKKKTSSYDLRKVSIIIKTSGEVPKIIPSVSKNKICPNSQLV